MQAGIQLLWDESEWPPVGAPLQAPQVTWGLPGQDQGALEPEHDWVEGGFIHLSQMARPYGDQVHPDDLKTVAHITQAPTGEGTVTGRRGRWMRVENFEAAPEGSMFGEAGGPHYWPSVLLTR